MSGVTSLRRARDASPASRPKRLIGEISGATNEQSIGISQIDDAVTQLDRVTQQNASLVKESAAAAESLKQQAQSLSAVVGAFRARVAVAG